ncbi:MAG: hypothetical protein GY705_27150 [Bacteroidetes bacterium]|nr:hypothetical protein [Bacteroidota bacterium]
MMWRRVLSLLHIFHKISRPLPALVQSKLLDDAAFHHIFYISDLESLDKGSFDLHHAQEESLGSSGFPSSGFPSSLLEVWDWNDLPGNSLPNL